MTSRVVADGSTPSPERPASTDQRERDREATSCFEECLDLSIRRGDWITAGWCRIHLSLYAFRDGDLDRAERLTHQVVDECRAAGARHPLGQALSNLSFIAHWRGEDEAALALIREAIAVLRDLDDRFQLSDALCDLAVQEAVVGHESEALQAMAESVRIDDVIGHRPGRPFRLATAAVIHLARGRRDAATAVMGAWLAHQPRPVPDHPPSRSGDYR